MYLVRVYREGKEVEKRTFLFGYWGEIGLWLDDLGYNGTGYEVRIVFIEAE